MHRNPRLPYVAGAVICLAAFFAMALAAGRNPDPAWLLSFETALLTPNWHLAEFFTRLGYWYVLLPACVAALGVALARPSWRLPALLTIVALLLAWQGADFFQHVFARPRRLDWIYKRETAFSFPSSHAAIATGFYAFWGWLLLATRAPLARAGGAVLIVAGLGIVWSRLALGAHYLTDVTGGILWGAAVVLLLVAAVSPIKVLGGRSQPS